MSTPGSGTSSRTAASSRAVAFSPDGKAVLTGSDDKTVRLWDAATGKPIGPPWPHQGRGLAVAFSPDGKTVLTGSDDKTARLWDAATGKALGPPLAHQGAVCAVAFSPDGKTVLTGSEDKTARLWDAATGKPIGPPLEHQGAVRAVAFSPDGKAVLTGSDDKTARLWAVTELPDDLPRLATWVEVVTGLELDEQGSVHALDNAAWRQRSRAARPGGGPTGNGRTVATRPHPLRPRTHRPRAGLDRARAVGGGRGRLQRGRPARPFDSDVLLERARFHAARSRPDKADEDFLQAYVLGSARRQADRDDLAERGPLCSCRRGAARLRLTPLEPRAATIAPDGSDGPRPPRTTGRPSGSNPRTSRSAGRQILSLMVAGELDPLRRARSDLLDRFGRTSVPNGRQ